MHSRETARRFHFLRELATGGFGSVYLAKVMHPDGFSRLVAIKLLKTQWAESEEVAKRTRDEARLLGLLNHNNIVKVLDLTSIDGRAAVIMEYIEAVDLRYVVDHYAEHGQRIPPRAAVEAAATVASALDDAYNRPPLPGDKPLRVIHRDIKPSNVMVDAGGLVKVLDFGVARSDIDSRESNTQELQFGSVDYMAPERLFFEPETPASDVYSLGATLYELLALEKLGKARGRPERHAAFLWDRMSFLRAHAGLSGTGATDLETLLRESLDYDHERRPTAADFAKRLKAIARTFGNDGLQGWAEDALPPLIERSQNEPRAPDNLTNSVLTEDSIIFRKSSPVTSFDPSVPDPSDPGGAEATEQTAQDDPATADNTQESGPATFEATELALGIEDAHDAPDPSPKTGLLQGSVMSEIEDSEIFVPSPITGSPAASRPARPFVDDQSEATGGWADPTATGLTDGSDVPDPRGLDEPDPVEDSGPTTMKVEEEAEPETLVDGTELFAGRGVTADNSTEVEPFPAVAAPTMAGEALDEPDTAEDDEVTDLAMDPHSAEEHTVSASLQAAQSGVSRGLGYAIMAMAAVVSAAFTVSAFGLAYWLDVGGLQTAIAELAAGDDGSGDEDLPPPPTDDPALDPSAGLHFVSEATGGSRLKVDCTGASAKGDDEVVVPLETASTCTVTVFLEDRNRISTVVSDVRKGTTYRCFEGGEAGCAPAM